MKNHVWSGRALTETARKSATIRRSNDEDEGCDVIQTSEPEIHNKLSSPCMTAGIGATIGLSGLYDHPGEPEAQWCLIPWPMRLHLAAFRLAAFVCSPRIVTWNHETKVLS